MAFLYLEQRDNQLSIIKYRLTETGSREDHTVETENDG